MVRGFLLGLVFGISGAAYATVACGSFDTTILKVTKVEKDGVAVALPSTLVTTIGSRYLTGDLYDPSLDTYVSIVMDAQP